MHARSPTSRSSFHIRVSLFDAIWAFAAPFLALLARDSYILSSNGALTAALYCAVAAGFSLFAFLAFRIRDQMARYFSVGDAINVVKAVLVAELMILIVLFTSTRLEGIPRSTPLIHALLLLAGLIGARTLVRLFHSEDTYSNDKTLSGAEHIMMIGANRLSSLFIKMLGNYLPDQHRIIGVLDTRPQMLGRTVSGIRVIGSPQDLEQIIDEFAVHGVRTTRVIVGGDMEFLSNGVRNDIYRACDERRIRLDFVPELIGLKDRSNPAPGKEPPRADSSPILELPAYFSHKRAIDVLTALLLLVFLLPILVMVALLALIDVGFPVLFWQQRIGRGGRTFLIYKFRTLCPPFDRHGQRITEAQRLSWIGALLRRTRLDELPQLLNVVVGDMSLVGPRPLLPEDQPENFTVRLTVRPGITGWAQVNGGQLLAAADKGALDEWYVKNASPWLDLRIMLLTLKILLRGRGAELPQKHLITGRNGFDKPAKIVTKRTAVAFLHQSRHARTNGNSRIMQSK